MKNGRLYDDLICQGIAVRVGHRHPGMPTLALDRPYVTLRQRRLEYRDDSFPDLSGSCLQGGAMDLERVDSASEHALRYMQNMDGVHGWLLPQAARCIVCLDDAQRRNGVRGSVAEIGVHHGKLFILLCLLRNEGEIAVGYDLFDQQDQNVDRSGKGSLEVLRDHLRHMNLGTSHVKLITANSLELTGARVVRDSESPVRLFSIDGGHTADITRNDLSIAAEAIADD